MAVRRIGERAMEEVVAVDANSLPMDPFHLSTGQSEGGW